MFVLTNMLAGVASRAVAAHSAALAEHPTAAGVASLASWSFRPTRLGAEARDTTEQRTHASFYNLLSETALLREYAADAEPLRPA